MWQGTLKGRRGCEGRRLLCQVKLRGRGEAVKGGGCCEDEKALCCEGDGIRAVRGLTLCCEGREL